MRSPNNTGLGLNGLHIYYLSSTLYWSHKTASLTVFHSIDLITCQITSESKILAYRNSQVEGGSGLKGRAIHPSGESIYASIIEGDTIVRIDLNNGSYV